MGEVLNKRKKKQETSAETWWLENNNPLRLEHKTIIWLVLERRLDTHSLIVQLGGPSVCAQGGLGFSQCIMDTLPWPQVWKNKWFRLNSWSCYILLCNLGENKTINLAESQFLKDKMRNKPLCTLSWLKVIKMLVTITDYERVSGIMLTPLRSVFYFVPLSSPG